MSSRKILTYALMALPASHASAARSLVKGRQQSCEAELLVDDFTQWEEGLNLLDGAAGHDETMEAIGVDDDGVLNFEPIDIDTSYLYEELLCVDAAAAGFAGLSFRIRGPESASVTLELQTRESCEGGGDDDDEDDDDDDDGKKRKVKRQEDYTSSYYTVNGLSGDLEEVVVPFDSWPEAQLGGVVGVVWFGFSAGREDGDNAWQLDDVKLSCSAEPPPEPEPEPEPTPTASVPVPPAPSPTSSESVEN